MIRPIKTIACVLTLAIFLAISVSAKVQLHSFDQIDGGVGGMNVTLVSSKTEHIEGTGALRSSSDNLLIVQATFNPVNLEKYAADGGLHFWLYIEDADALDGNGQIELTSSGTCDVEETHWFIYSSPYEDGWNEMWFPFYASEVDEMNYAACNYFRIYNYLYYDTYMIVDDISIGLRSDFPTLDSEEKPYDSFTKLESDTKAPLLGNIDEHETVYDQSEDEAEAFEDGYAGLDGAGAIEDRIETEDTSGNNPILYVGVIVFSAVAVIATVFVVFVRQYHDEDEPPKESKQDE